MSENELDPNNITLVVSGTSQSGEFTSMALMQINLKVTSALNVQMNGQLVLPEEGSVPLKFANEQALNRYVTAYNGKTQNAKAEDFGGDDALLANMSFANKVIVTDIPSKLHKEDQKIVHDFLTTVFPEGSNPQDYPYCIYSASSATGHLIESITRILDADDALGDDRTISRNARAYLLGGVNAEAGAPQPVANNSQHRQQFRPVQKPLNFLEYAQAVKDAAIEAQQYTEELSAVTVSRRDTLEMHKAKTEPSRQTQDDNVFVVVAATPEAIDQSIHNALAIGRPLVFANDAIREAYGEALIESGSSDDEVDEFTRTSKVLGDVDTRGKVMIVNMSDYTPLLEYIQSNESKPILVEELKEIIAQTIVGAEEGNSVLPAGIVFTFPQMDDTHFRQFSKVIRGVLREIGYAGNDLNRVGFNARDLVDDISLAEPELMYLSRRRGVLAASQTVDDAAVAQGVAVAQKALSDEGWSVGAEALAEQVDQLMLSDGIEGAAAKQAGTYACEEFLG